MGISFGGVRLILDVELCKIYEIKECIERRVCLPICNKLYSETKAFNGTRKTIWKTLWLDYFMFLKPGKTPMHIS